MADFTPEQLEAIEAAMKNHCSYFDEISHVITELQKPAWVPKDNQIIVLIRNNSATRMPKDSMWQDYYQEEYRPATATEIGLEPFEYLDDESWSIGQTSCYNQAIKLVNKTLFGDTE